jgi:surface polysaccharide O-acyltransferase-like enzyme
MASGAVLLRAGQDYKSMWKKLLRIVLALVIFSYVEFALAGDSIPWSDFPKYLVSLPSGNLPINFYYYYLYIYMALLLLMPLLSKLVLALEKKDFQWLFLIVGFFAGTWPIIQHYFPDLKLSIHFTAVLFGTYLVIFIAGYYYNKLQGFRKKSQAAVAFLALLVLLAAQTVGTVFEAKKGIHNFLFYDNRQLITIVASAVLLFLLAKYFFARVKLSAKAERILVWLSQHTFGIYLLHIILLNKFDTLRNMIFDSMPTLLALLLYELFVFSVALVTVWLLRKIPLIKKIL